MKLGNVPFVLFSALTIAAIGCSDDNGGNKDGGGTGGRGTGGSGTGGSGTGGSGTGGSGTGGSGTGGAATGGSGGSGGSTTDGGGDARTDGGTTEGGSTTDGGTSPMMNFFVTSDTRPNGNLGGLAMSDARCQMLATAVGQGSKTWKAYLSVASPATNARDRIGDGPYFNSKGVMVAENKNALHMRNGDPEIFLDEKGNKINGQWNRMPDASTQPPNEHDILTGSSREGMLVTGATCSDWTDGTTTTLAAMAGHSDGMGPNMNTAGMLAYWTGSHASMGNCANTATGGGSGKIYCFVGP
jgi:hypothetical protein